MAKKTLKRDDGKESAIDIYVSPTYTSAGTFPTLTNLFKIPLTIVVSTAQCERSFSALTRIKTHLRTTMTNRRIADISLLSQERDLNEIS
jgi:hypothetical protein